jgi:hypothetical protein
MLCGLLAFHLKITTDGQFFFLSLSSLSVRGNQREENKARRAAAAGEQKV